MNSYYAKIHYYKATMEYPWCLVEGERNVMADTEEEARQEIIKDAEFRSIDCIQITELKLVKGN